MEAKWGPQTMHQCYPRVFSVPAPWRSTLRAGIRQFTCPPTGIARPHMLQLSVRVRFSTNSKASLVQWTLEPLPFLAGCGRLNCPLLLGQLAADLAAMMADCSIAHRCHLSNALRALAGRRARNGVDAGYKLAALASTLCWALGNSRPGGRVQLCTIASMLAPRPRAGRCDAASVMCPASGSVTCRGHAGGCGASRLACICTDVIRRADAKQNKQLDRMSDMFGEPTLRTGVVRVALDSGRGPGLPVSDRAEYVRLPVRGSQTRRVAEERYATRPLLRQACSASSSP